MNVVEVRSKFFVHQQGLILMMRSLLPAERRREATEASAAHKYQVTIFSYSPARSLQ